MHTSTDVGARSEYSLLNFRTRARARSLVPPTKCITNKEKNRYTTTDEATKMKKKDDDRFGSSVLTARRNNKEKSDKGFTRMNISGTHVNDNDLKCSNAREIFELNCALTARCREKARCVHSARMKEKRGKMAKRADETGKVCVCASHTRKVDDR